MNGDDPRAMRFKKAVLDRDSTTLRDLFARHPELKDAIDEPWFYTGLGVTRASLPVALLLFLLVIPTFAVFVQPLLSSLSRRHEFEADEFAARQADAGDLIRALVKLYRENANTLTPDPLYSAFHDSHPPASLRVANLESKRAG